MDKNNQKNMEFIKRTIDPIPISFKDMNMYLNLEENITSTVSLIPGGKQNIKIDISNKLNNPYFVLYTTYACNLSCEYCFHSREKINLCNSTPQYAFDELYYFMRRNNITCPEIRFFGGEPLLNKKWIYECVAYFKTKDIDCKYNIFTNGTILDNKFIDFAAKNGISFYISVGGHNEEEKGVKYKEKIKNNIQNLKIKNIQYYARVVYRPLEINLVELIRETKDKDLVALSITTEWGSKLDLKIAYNHLIEFSEYYIRKIANYEFEFMGIHPFVGYMWKWLINKNYNIEQCSCGKEIYSVALDGRIYPCQCFNENRKFECGKIQREYKALFEKFNADTLEQCNQCKIKYFCKYRCYADAYYCNGDVKKFDEQRCTYEKMIVGCSAYIIYRLSREFPRQYRIFCRFLRNYSNYNNH